MPGEINVKEPNVKMSAWDLSRRFEQSTPQHPATIPIGGQQIYQLQQHLLAQPTNLWHKLSFDEQFHALLATATRAVALEAAAATNSATINKLTTTSNTPNLIPHLDQVHSFNKHLAPTSHENLLSPILFASNPVLDCDNRNLAPRLNLFKANEQYSALDESESARKSSLTSSRSLTPSPSSSRSNSAESVDLSLSKRLTPLVADNNDDFSSTNYSLSSRASCSSSSSGSTTSSCSGGDSSCEKSTSRIGPNQVVADKRLRKKDQNRRAAYNYRRKKMEERDKMIEEEARLVHKHVRLAGKIARLEDKILTILSTKTRRIQNKGGQTMCYLCPVCSDLCDTVTNLRNHLRANHLQQLYMDNCQNLWNNDPVKKVFGCFDDNHDNKDGNHNDGEVHSSLYSINPERSVVNDNFVNDNVGYDDSNSLM